MSFAVPNEQRSARARVCEELPHRNTRVHVPSSELDAQPPYTNRGVGITSRPDFLTGTVRNHSVEELKDLLSSYYEGAEFVDNDFGGFFYKNSTVGMFNTKIYWTEGRDDIFLFLPGKACAYLGLENILIICSLTEINLTRIDWCFDYCPFEVDHIKDAWLSNNVNSKVPRDSWDEFNNAKGHTFYIGSKKSDRRLVCYDMRGFTRLEFRSKGDKAQALLNCLYECEDMDEMPEKVLGIITGYADFIDRSQTDSNTTRSTQRSDWWNALVGSVQKIRLAPREIQQTVQGLVDHVVTRVATSVFTFVEILNKRGPNDTWWRDPPFQKLNEEKILWELYKIGKRKSKSRHHALIAMAGPAEPDYTPF